MPRAKPLFKNVLFKDKAYEVARGADALAILTEWDEFGQLDFKKIKTLMKHPVIFDGRNMLNPKTIKKLGFQYHAIGRKI